MELTEADYLRFVVTRMPLRVPAGNAVTKV